MGETPRPKLSLIRGGAGTTDSGDHANPHGIPRPAGIPMPKRSSHPSMGAAFNPGANKSLDVPFSEPSVDSDPTPPHGITRPKQFKVIKGGKE